MLWNRKVRDVVILGSKSNLWKSPGITWSIWRAAYTLRLSSRLITHHVLRKRTDEGRKGTWPIFETVTRVTKRGSETCHNAGCTDKWSTPNKDGPFSMIKSTGIAATNSLRTDNGEERMHSAPVSRPHRGKQNVGRRVETKRTQSRCHCRKWSACLEAPVDSLLSPSLSVCVRAHIIVGPLLLACVAMVMCRIQH